MLEIVSFVLGPVETNTYLVADVQRGEAVVVDPAWDGEEIAAEARKRNWRITSIWLTHAHFDHMGGVSGLLHSLATAQQPVPPVALHPDDLPLWETQGGAPLFGMYIDPGPRPTLSLAHHQKLVVGGYSFEVRHAPGHSPGHVVFACADEKVVFCGDVIFMGSIGRTDLPGGSYTTLLHSIQQQILTMPDDTRLLPGHGPETTVEEERQTNPFLT